MNEQIVIADLGNKVALCHYLYKPYIYEMRSKCRSDESPFYTAGRFAILRTRLVVYVSEVTSFSEVERSSGVAMKRERLRGDMPSTINGYSTHHLYTTTTLFLPLVYLTVPTVQAPNSSHPHSSPLPPTPSH